MLAMLCVALAMVFAGASSASVVDDLQHETGVAHEHGAQLSLVSVDDHAAVDAGQAHEHADDEAAGQEVGDVSDPAPGAGHHHHADAPVGAPGGSVTVEAAHLASAVSGAEPRETNPKGVRPGGLERPPRPLAILV